ncbi:putative glutathione S-transferase, partial [Cucurbita argyrosperma subsp. sororia]
MFAEDTKAQGPRSNFPKLEERAVHKRGQPRELKARLQSRGSELRREMGEELKLFRTWSTPFALRIVWALKLKGLEYDTVYEDLANKSPQLLEYNPVHKKVPVLVHGGKPVAESLVILEYIDEMWKQNPLLPQDPYQRAAARFWAKFGDEKVLESIRKALMNQGKVREEGVEEALENMKHLEGELEGKRFFGGEAIGFVDIALGWLANIVSVMEEVIGVELITEQRFPLLWKWIHEFAAAPIINETWPPRDKLVARYQAIDQSSMSKQA